MERSRLVWESSSSESDSGEINIKKSRKPRNFRPRIDNFNKWNDEEFFFRFRLTKPTVLMILNLINDKIEFPTNR